MQIHKAICFQRIRAWHTLKPTFIARSFRGCLPLAWIMSVVPFYKLHCTTAIAPNTTGRRAHLLLCKRFVGAPSFFRMRSFSNASFRYFSSKSSSSGAPRRGVAGGTLHPDSVDPFKPQKRRQMDLKLGPYAGGRFFVSPKEDPKEFILCVLIVCIFLYTLVTTYTQPGKVTADQRT